MARIVTLFFGTLLFPLIAGAAGIRFRRALRGARAHLSASRVSEQDLAHDERRCRCSSAPRAHAGILWLLRLAFSRARPLAAGAPGAIASRRAIRTRGARSARSQLHT